MLNVGASAPAHIRDKPHISTIYTSFVTRTLNIRAQPTPIAKSERIFSTFSSILEHHYFVLFGEKMIFGQQKLHECAEKEPYVQDLLYYITFSFKWKKKEYEKQQFMPKT